MTTVRAGHDHVPAHTGHTLPTAESNTVTAVAAVIAAAVTAVIAPAVIAVIAATVTAVIAVIAVIAAAAAPLLHRTGAPDGRARDGCAWVKAAVSRAGVHGPCARTGHVHSCPAAATAETKDHARTGHVHARAVCTHGPCALPAAVIAVIAAGVTAVIAVIATAVIAVIATACIAVIGVIATCH